MKSHTSRKNALSPTSLQVLLLLLLFLGIVHALPDDVLQRSELYVTSPSLYGMRDVENSLVVGQPVSVELPVDCLVLCMTTPLCVAINLGDEGDDGRRQCELKDHRWEQPRFLSPATGFSYFAVGKYS